MALRRDIFESVYHHGKYTYWKQIMKCCNIAMPKLQNKNVKYGFYKNIVSHDYLILSIIKAYLIIVFL